MKKPPAKGARKVDLKPRLRVMAGEEIALGPGKIDLLALVEETGSIRQAAARLEMSYMRAWTLVRTMNRCFRAPLVQSLRGGGSGGGAVLTPQGKKILVIYREMESRAMRASAPAWRRLRRYLR